MFGWKGFINSDTVFEGWCCQVTCDNENDIVNIVISLTLLKSKTVGGRV